MEKKKENKIWIGKDGIIYVEIVDKDLSGENVFKIMEDTVKVVGEFLGKAKILVSFVEPVFKVGDSKFRKKLVDLTIEAYKNPGFEKLAICGVSTIVRIASLFVVKTTKLTNIRVFKTKEQSLKWLKEF